MCPPLLFFSVWRQWSRRGEAASPILRRPHLLGAFDGSSCDSILALDRVLDHVRCGAGGLPGAPRGGARGELNGWRSSARAHDGISYWPANGCAQAPNDQGTQDGSRAAGDVARRRGPLPREEDRARSYGERHRRTRTVWLKGSSTWRSCQESHMPHEAS